MPLAPCCVQFETTARIVRLTLVRKIGVVALALVFVALPVMACAVPAAVMTSAERECCQKMAGHCEEMGMAKDHPCCRQTTVSSDTDAVKTAPSQDHHVSLIVFHALTVPSEASLTFLTPQWSARTLYTHGPPGLAPTFQTILRI